MAPQNGAPDSFGTIWWNAWTCCLADASGKMKFDLNGDSLWMHEYSDGQFYKINRNSVGSFYCVGYEGDSAVLVKVDENGIRLFSKYFIVRKPDNQSAIFNFSNNFFSSFHF